MTSQFPWRRKASAVVARRWVRCTRALGALGLALAGAPLAAEGQSARASASRPLTPADSDAADRAFLAAEAEADARELGRLRTQYLRRAAWADLGDRCTHGALRVFPGDTTRAAQDSVQAIVDQMERILVRRGVGGAIDTPVGRALLRVVVGWEAGIDRPSWDGDEKGPSRVAVATGLTGEVPDPTGSGCLPSPVASDTVTFVLPGFTDMEFPKASRPRVKAYFGAEGQRQARDEFFTAVGSKNPEAEFAYAIVAPMVLWRDYAVVAVRRPVERGGFDITGGGRGGATYLFRRVGTGWRLLSIVRTWGG
jgi:hypothetical protein